MIAKQTEKARVMARRAFTLMEMLVVVSIIVVLAGMGGYYFLRAADDAKKNTARVQVKTTLSNACEEYYLKNSSWPPDLQSLLVQDQNGGGPYLKSQDAIIDPWGKQYQYSAQGANNGGRQPDIWTDGPGGVQIGNWQSTH
jgi:general secretion pathway protein G